MHHREPRSFSGLMNLDEAGRVSMMSIGSAHQRLLLQTSRQQKKLIRTESRVTTPKILKCLSIKTAATMSVVHDHLPVRKQCSRWIPHSLTEEQRRVRVERCEAMLRKFNGGRSKLTWEVLTGDGTWIYRSNPETKMQSAVLLFLDEFPPQNSEDHAAHRRNI